MGSLAPWTPTPQRKIINVIGRLAEANYGFMGFIPNPTPLREGTAEEVAQKLKEADVCIAFLTAG